MKKYIFFGISLVFSFYVKAQDSLFLYKNGVVIYKKAVTDIDSITFHKISPNTTANLLTDIEGNVYKIVTIGTQIWMAENLKVSKYNDGINIPLVADALGWSNLNSPGMCWYNYDKDFSILNSYGALYNWYTINTNKICPIGWHIPSNTEFSILTNFLGGQSTVGMKLKMNSGWVGNSNGTNQSGFGALPAGYRNTDGSFSGSGQNQNEMTIFPTISVSNPNFFGRYLNAESNFNESLNDKKLGVSIRCIKD